METPHSGTARVQQESIMASENSDPTRSRSEDEQRSDTTPKPRAYPDDDGPKSAGYLNEGDGPLPKKEQLKAPRP